MGQTVHAILRSDATKNLRGESSARGQLGMPYSAACEGRVLKHNLASFLSRKGGYHTLREKR